VNVRIDQARYHPLALGIDSPVYLRRQLKRRYSLLQAADFVRLEQGGSDHLSKPQRPRLKADLITVVEEREASGK